MPDEIEMAIGLEEEEIQGALRVFITAMMVIAWPIVIMDLMRR